MNDTAILHRYANPKAFSDLAASITPIAGIIALALFAIGLPWSLIIAVSPRSRRCATDRAAACR